jgi:hypothetical protein
LQYENFVEIWSQFDPRAAGLIQWHLLPKLIQQLDEPLGYGGQNEVSAKELTAFIGTPQALLYAPPAANVVVHRQSSSTSQSSTATAYSSTTSCANSASSCWTSYVRCCRACCVWVWSDGSVTLQVNEAPVPDLPSTIAVSQKWRALMKGSKTRKSERYHVKHLHASVLLHDAVRSLVFREELRARVHKFTDLTRGLLDPPPKPKGDGLSSRRGSTIGLHSFAEEED